MQNEDVIGSGCDPSSGGGGGGGGWILRVNSGGRSYMICSCNCFQTLVIGQDLVKLKGVGTAMHLEHRRKSFYGLTKEGGMEAHGVKCVLAKQVQVFHWRGVCW